MEHVSFKIEGMSCSCEAGIIERRMKRLKGVEDYAFLPISNVMKLSYDPGRVTIEEIQKAAAKAGVKAVLQPSSLSSRPRGGTA